MDTTRRTSPRAERSVISGPDLPGSDSSRLLVESPVMAQTALGRFSPRFLLALLAVLSPGPRLAGTPSRGIGSERLKQS